MPPYRPIDVAAVYVSMFPARTDVYASWTRDGWRPVRQELTAERAYRGLDGSQPPVSGYMIAPGGVGHSFALDFDGETGYTQAQVIARTAWGMDIPVYIEDSARGAHLWGVMEAVAPARLIRNALRYLIQASGLDPDDPKIELRPGSDDVDAVWDLAVDPPVVVGTGLGHAIRLPLMPHPRTGKRGRLIDPNYGFPLGTTVAEMLLNWQLVPWPAMADAHMRWVPRVDPNNLPAYARPPRAKLPEDQGSACDILRELWGCQNAAPGRTVRCPAHEDKKASLSILRDDKRVVCKAGYCVLNNDDRGRGLWELRNMAPTAAAS